MHLLRFKLIQRKNQMYWANSRRITVVQLIYAAFGEREEEEEETHTISNRPSYDL